MSEEVRQYVSEQELADLLRRLAELEARVSDLEKKPKG